MSSDLDWRKLFSEFTVYEAASAILNIMKPDIENNYECMLIVKALLISIKDCELPCNLVMKYRKVFVHDELGGHYISEENGEDWAATTIARKDLVAWCEKRNYRPAFLFPDPPADVIENLQKESIDPALQTELQDELPDYHTPALDALIAAIRHFWLNHDPNPKREDIVKWLMEQHGMTQSMASAIDRIIRPEGRRKGGNIKRA